MKQTLSGKELMINARNNNKVIPSFNISYLPMVEPVVKACRDANSFGQIALARVDWTQFGAGNLESAYKEYRKFSDSRYVSLHLDHIPVVEDGKQIDYETIISRAIELGFHSVMIDGSMLDIDENISAVKKITKIAKPSNIAVEAEVGAVVGYKGIDIPYEELFTSRQGFTDIEQAKRLVTETSVDWLSVAIGNVHGALTAAKRNLTKITARLDIDHLTNIYNAVGIPIVLHGGSGIDNQYILKSILNGISKINIATTIRQAYESGIKDSIETAQQKVYDAVTHVLIDELKIRNSADLINPLN